jgi:hypothetical protein
VKILIRSAIAAMCLMPTAALAQEPPPVPPGATEPQGFIAEPDVLTRAVLFADRHLGKGDLTNGIYVDYGNMIPGAGWASIGPGYRHWYADDAFFVDASAGISINGYKAAQARAELPALLKSRLVLGTQARWQNFGRVDYFGDGPDSSLEAASVYGVKSTQIMGYVTLRPVRWLDIDSQIGWMNPEARYVEGPLQPPVFAKREFIFDEVAATVDTRDFPGHPTRGVVLRGAASRYDDRVSGAHTFNRYEGELAGFVPIAGGRAVLGVHGWVVRSDVEPGQTVPLYLQPSLGGVNSLRSFADYRFRDDNMLLTTAELRLAMMSHLDLAVFADAGNVAARAGDLDLAKRSYGTGLRFHTRRETFAMVDVAHGSEGWHAMFRLKDPLMFGRLSRKTTIVPFVP